MEFFNVLAAWKLLFYRHINDLIEEREKTTNNSLLLRILVEYNFTHCSTILSAQNGIKGVSLLEKSTRALVVYFAEYFRALYNSGPCFSSGLTFHSSGFFLRLFSYLSFPSPFFWCFFCFLLLVVDVFYFFLLLASTLLFCRVSSK